MNSGIFIIALFFYWIIEFYIRKVSNVAGEVEFYRIKRKTGREWTALVSPGYWFSLCEKSKIDALPEYKRMHSRRHFIVSSNKNNLYLSLVFCLIVFISNFPSCGLAIQLQLLQALVLVRMISRTFEIAFAFGIDVISRDQNRSGLSKFSRLQLAFRSYIEIFLLSAPVYYSLGVADNKSAAWTMSLSVGTLTNIGYAFPGDHLLVANIVFAQVFSTLSLVLLSLAVYISRASRRQHFNSFIAANPPCRLK